MWSYNANYVKEIFTNGHGYDKGTTINDWLLPQILFVLSNFFSFANETDDLFIQIFELFDQKWELLWGWLPIFVQFDCINAGLQYA